MGRKLEFRSFFKLKSLVGMYQFKLQFASSDAILVEYALSTSGTYSLNMSSVVGIGENFTNYEKIGDR